MTLSSRPEKEYRLVCADYTGSWLPLEAATWELEAILDHGECRLMHTLEERIKVTV